MSGKTGQPKLYQLELRVTIYDTRTGGPYGQINVSENFCVPATNFLEICELLGRFHKLAEELKAPDVKI